MIIMWAIVEGGGIGAGGSGEDKYYLFFITCAL